MTLVNDTRDRRQGWWRQVALQIESHIHSDPVLILSTVAPYIGSVCPESQERLRNWRLRFRVADALEITERGLQEMYHIGECNIYMGAKRTPWMTQVMEISIKIDHSFNLYCVESCKWYQSMVQKMFIHHLWDFENCIYIYIIIFSVDGFTWWCPQMETFSTLLALCVGNSPVTGEFTSQRPVTRSFDVLFDLCLNKGWANNRVAGDLRHHRAHWRHCNV